ncbi:uncharacterized protein RJT21DRAFT_54389 [Scheffersomyces amazonensis]|uniref:uncharacterized protein n=1 Tax=Scheffersomyces amazonensis TaxID=1078765 RepID=UPI00315CC8A3
MADHEDDFPSHLEQTQEQEDLDNPLRVILVINVPEAEINNNESSGPDTSSNGEMEERLLDSIQSFEDMNTFFDDFDDIIAYPNEGHIKYEVGSDGLVIIVVDNVTLRDKVLEFMDKYTTQGKTDDKEAESEKPSKKVKV